MQLSFELEVAAPIKKIWEFYIDLNNWYLWEDDLRDIELNGEFKTGTMGSMLLEGMPKIHFELTNVETNKAWCDKTVIPHMGDLYFNHEIISIDDLVLVRHSVELKTTILNLEKIKFMENIFADVPSSVYKLKTVLENE